ncbi:hypothetical protein QMZ05_31005 [Bradyrhizobium sp. INPA03-11B]|uniref:hypothetical protein n=1 Tax=Bradyrhizobium sp. INPA03-11B TaxID=418598 RepID=UPI00338F3F3B
MLQPAIHPLAGMNTASDNRQEVIAGLSVSGQVPTSAAIASSKIAITLDRAFIVGLRQYRHRGV